jgi:hypothetical protein
MPDLHPVIHHRDIETTLANVELARKYRCSGVFLIDMNGGKRDELFAVGHIINKRTAELYKAIGYSYEGFKLGINDLSSKELFTIEDSTPFGYVWVDNPGVTSKGANSHALNVNHLVDVNGSIRFFGSVAFKTQDYEPDPAQAAINARNLGWVVVTSGPRTGSPPDVEKIKTMKEALGDDGELALASGITPDNVDEFLPYVDYFLVATGISKNFHEFDEEKLAKLAEKIERDKNEW